MVYLYTSITTKLKRLINKVLEISACGLVTAGLNLAAQSDWLAQSFKEKLPGLDLVSCSILALPIQE